MAKEIKLPQGKVTAVDDADFEWLNQWKWSAQKGRHCWYVLRYEGTPPLRKKIYMHAQIMGTPKGQKTDHKDGDGLNNQRANLRVCTASQNAHNCRMRSDNTSGYKGVTWDSAENKWKAQIGRTQGSRQIGRFDTAVEAALAYDKVARKEFGDFAVLNFPEYV